ncbi:MAG: hypothetical protein Q9193_006425 [Seirophora villosa]
MVVKPGSSELAHVDLLPGLDYQPPCNHPLRSPTDFWYSVGVHSMAEELFNHGYPEAAYQDPNYQNMSNMQRFLEEKETYFAGRHGVYDGRQPLFNGEKLSPAVVSYHDAPQPWPQQLHIPHTVYHQEPCTRGWTLSDPDSWSATTGKTWSPRASESCPDQDPRYLSWPAPHGYPAGYALPNYDTSLAQGVGLSSPQSVTGTLSEIQQSPDNEAECASMTGRMHVSDHGCLDSTADRITRTATHHPNEVLCSTANESVPTSPDLRDENVAMESVSGDDNGDGDRDGSDYSPQSRLSRKSKTQKGRAKLQTKGLRSPTTKRSSVSKKDLHQLTTPAKITKRTSPQSKPDVQASTSMSPPVSKPSNPHDFACTQCESTFPSVSALQKHTLSAHTRPFICSFRRYGCTSRFGSKNEWKRHVSSQHLRPGIYRCDLGPCAPTQPLGSPPRRSKPEQHNNNNNNRHQAAAEQQQSHNDFNRKDLFTQHLRRMHAPGLSASRPAKDAFTNGLEAVRRRCWILLRETPPRSICPYCAPHPSRPSPPPADASAAAKKKASKPVVFEGKGSWDERMEHVGRHLEKEGGGGEEDMGVEVEDVGLRDWMVREGLVSWEKGAWVVVGAGGRRRRGAGVAVTTAAVKKEEDEEEEEDADGEADADGEEE